MKENICGEIKMTENTILQNNRKNISFCKFRRDDIKTMTKQNHDKSEIDDIKEWKI